MLTSKNNNKQNSNGKDLFTFNYVYELCPHCEYEVKLDSIKFIKQPCPNCGELIRACSMCTEQDIYGCKNCT